MSRLLMLRESRDKAGAIKPHPKVTASGNLMRNSNLVDFLTIGANIKFDNPNNWPPLIIFLAVMAISY